MHKTAEICNVRTRGAVRRPYHPLGAMRSFSIGPPAREQTEARRNSPSPLPPPPSPFPSCPSHFPPFLETIWSLSIRCAFKVYVKTMFLKRVTVSQYGQIRAILIWVHVWMYLVVTYECMHWTILT
jgi:hypothetical protein